MSSDWLRSLDTLRLRLPRLLGRNKLRLSLGLGNYGELRLSWLLRNSELRLSLLLNRCCELRLSWLLLRRCCELRLSGDKSLWLWRSLLRDGLELWLRYSLLWWSLLRSSLLLLRVEHEGWLELLLLLLVARDDCCACWKPHLTPCGPGGSSSSI